MRPRFKSHLHPHIVSDDLVVLASEAGLIPVESRLTAILAPLLDGRNTVPEIIMHLDDRITALDVRYGLERLEQLGFISTRDGDEDETRVDSRSVPRVDENVAKLLQEARICDLDWY